MKIKSLFTLLFILMFTSLFTSCRAHIDNTGDTTASETEAPTATADSTPLSTDDEAFALSILGTWEGIDNNITYTYIFKEDNKSNITVSFSETSAPYEATWEIKQNKLCLTFPEGDGTYTQEFDFELTPESLTLKYEGQNLKLLKKTN